MSGLLGRVCEMWGCMSGVGQASGAGERDCFELELDLSRESGCMEERTAGRELSASGDMYRSAESLHSVASSGNTGGGGSGYK